MSVEYSEATEVEQGDLQLLPHDIEEFGVIVHRWGLWRSDVQDFSKAVQLHLQLGSGADG